MSRNTKNKSAQLVKNTLIISVGSAGASVLKMVNVLLFTHFVAVEQVGDYDVITTYVNLMTPISMLALNESVFRWLLDESKDRRRTITTTLFITVACLLIFDVAAALVLYLLNFNYAKELIFCVTSGALYSFSQFATRGLRNNMLYAVQGIIYSIALLTSNVVLIVGFGMQASGLLWSVVIANIVATLFAVVMQRVIRDYISPEYLDLDQTRDLLAYSAPMVPNDIAWWLVSASNRVIINNVIGSAANGIFAISNRFPSVMNLLTKFFYQAWQEQAITEYTDAERDAYYSKVFNSYVRIIFGGVLLLLPASKLVVDILVDAKFAESSYYLGPLFLSSSFNALAVFYGTGYLSTRQTIGAFTTSLVGAVVNISVTSLLIGSVGLYAAALGSMFGNLAIWIVRVVQTRKYFVITVDMLPLTMGVLLAVAMSIVVPTCGIWQLMCLECVAVALFVAMNLGMLKRFAGAFARHHG